MKIHKPNTDYELELTIFANGQKCPEYVLPDAEDDPSAAVCYIPIAQDDTITIQGKFSGSFLRCHVDVLADGSWVANRVIEGDESDVKNGLLTHFDKRRVDIKTFLQVPDMQERKHNMRPNVAEGNLVIKRLPPALQALQLNGGDEKTGVGVGSLTVTVSLNQQAFETYGEANKYVYYNYTLGSWRDHVSDVKRSGIKPEHEMRMEIFPGSNPIENKKATYFWRDLKGPRPGETAWAYLIFYYRTQEAIDEAGCVLRTETKALLPDKGTFMRASDQAKIPQNDEGSSSPSPAPVLKTAPIAPESPPASGPKRTMGLGQPLKLHSGQGMIQQRSSPAIDDNETTMTMGKVKPKEGAKSKSAGIVTPNQQTQSRTSSPGAQSLGGGGSRSLFTSSLFSGAGRDGRAAHTSSAMPAVEPDVDDLATPSLLSQRKSSASTKTRQTPKAQPKPLTQPPPTSTQSPEPSTQPSSKKRTMSQVADDAQASTSALDKPSLPAAKNARREEMAARKAKMEAELQAKHERLAAAQRKKEETRRQREEHEKRMREEKEAEERQRAALEEEQNRMEEEAFEAEMEALRREAAAADEAAAELEEDAENEQRAFEEMMGSKGARY